MKLIKSTSTIALIIFSGIPSFVFGAKFYSLSVDQFCKTNFGNSSTARLNGNFAYSWKCQDIENNLHSVDMNLACMQQLHTSSVAVLLGGGSYDWRCVEWSDFDKQVVPVIIVARELVFDLKSINTAINNSTNVLNYVKRWYGQHTLDNMTFVFSRPLIVFSQQGIAYWNNLACQTAGERERTKGCSQLMPTDRRILYDKAKELVLPILKKVDGSTLSVSIFVFTGVSSSSPGLGAMGDIYTPRLNGGLYFNVQPPSVAACDGSDLWCGTYSLGHELGHNFSNAGHACDRNPRPVNCHNSITQFGKPPNATLVDQELLDFQKSPFLHSRAN